MQLRRLYAGETVCGAQSSQIVRAMNESGRTWATFSSRLHSFKTVSCQFIVLPPQSFRASSAWRNCGHLSALFSAQTTPPFTVSDRPFFVSLGAPNRVSFFILFDSPNGATGAPRRQALERPKLQREAPKRSSEEKLPGSKGPPYRL